MTHQDTQDRHDADEWARWDGDRLLAYPRSIQTFHRDHERLPIPVAMQVREAHRLLGKVIENLDEKKETPHAA